MSNMIHRPACPSGGLSRIHLTGISDLSDTDLFFLLDLAQYYGRLTRENQMIPQRLACRTQVNLFLENSTRTNVSFELAGKKLGADVLVLPVAASSVHKGEALRDTCQTLAAMMADAMIVRNVENGTSAFVAEALAEVGLPCAVINAGEGTSSHPTQALLDAVTILDSLGRKAADGLADITVAICGDVRHSRVAGSNMELLQRLGARVRCVGPEEFMPTSSDGLHIEQFTDLREGLQDCQFVMGLRIQLERMKEGPAMSVPDFHNTYGLTHETLKYAASGAKVMHPGPMNRGVEIDGALADDRTQSLVLDQVANGVTTRMAVLDALLTEQD
ncbi:aspartate carbamoyltransferase catalytic subunit [Parvularcula sp. IMCC14364]|uniref:aspartate carbamoyltransferase catalytic subunit n=1 Tax=Parvularcula sp. IMCC14364 TaxID=3067902 RepID=UPI002741DEAD|nr:aspartate carbamoyltransferase catalytic subunit [Parvularcula sp. IMCC14364]